MNSVSSAEKSILPKKSPFGNCCWQYICEEKFDSVALRSHLTACFNSDNKETKTDGIAARDYNGNIVFNVEELLILRTDDEKMNDDPENEPKKKKKNRRRKRSQTCKFFNW